MTTNINLYNHSSSEIAILAGGCFWCLEAAFEKVQGIIHVENGYANGLLEHAPTYEEVCTGRTGFAEVVHVKYDPKKVNFDILLNIFFAIHDPTTLNRQGADVGTQYRSAIFTLNDDQPQQADKKIQDLTQSAFFSAPIVTVVEPLKNYYSAEAYHQNYFAKHPHEGYCQMVIQPKLNTLRAQYSAMLKK